MSAQTQATSQTVAVSSVHKNTAQTLIEITEDKLELVLMRHLSALEKKTRWQFPAGILATIVPLFLTTEFKSALGIDKATWNAFFLFIAVGSTVWLIYTARQAFASVTIVGIIENIKNASSPPSQKQN